MRFLRLRINFCYVGPQILNRHSFQFVRVTLPPKPLGLVFWKVKPALMVPLFHFFLRDHPTIWRRLVAFVLVYEVRAMRWINETRGLESSAIVINHSESLADVILVFRRILLYCGLNFASSDRA